MVNSLSPFGNGHLLPRGTLRELPKQALRRADAVVLHHVDLLGGWAVCQAAACSNGSREAYRAVQECSGSARWLGSLQQGRPIGQRCVKLPALPACVPLSPGAAPERREAVQRQLTSVAPRHTIFFQTQMSPVGLRSLIPQSSSLGAQQGGAARQQCRQCRKSAWQLLTGSTAQLGLPTHQPGAMHMFPCSALCPCRYEHTVGAGRVDTPQPAAQRRRRLPAGHRQARGMQRGARAAVCCCCVPNWPVTTLSGLPARSLPLAAFPLQLSTCCPLSLSYHSADGGAAPAAAGGSAHRGVWGV